MVEMLKQYYLKEEGCELLVRDYVFCAYKYDSEYKNLMINHLFISEEARKDGRSHIFWKDLQKIAKEMGAERFVGNIFLNQDNFDEYTKKVKIHLGFGYKIVDVTEKCITVMKEL